MWNSSVSSKPERLNTLLGLGITLDTRMLIKLRAGIFRLR